MLFSEEPKKSFAHNKSRRTEPEQPSPGGPLGPQRSRNRLLGLVIRRRSLGTTVFQEITGPLVSARSFWRSVPEAPVRSHRRHEKRTYNLASRRVSVGGGNRSAMQSSTRSSAKPPIPAGLCSNAIGSQYGENPREWVGNCFAVLNAVGGNAESESTNSGDGALACRTICHHAWHRFDVCPPSAIFLLPYQHRNGFDSDGLHKPQLQYKTGTRRSPEIVPSEPKRSFVYTKVLRPNLSNPAPGPLSGRLQEINRLA